jgi:uncharacterized protein (TIGR02001 family)
LVWLATSTQADVTARLAISSAYLHRGLEQTRSSPAYQAALEYQAAGWFAGVWASTVDFASYDNRSSEIDYYLGYGKRYSRNLALEAVLIRYTYQGGSPRDDNWGELQLSAYVADRLTLTWGIADGWWASDERARFVEGTYRHPLPARLTLDTTVGYQLADRAAGLDYGYAEAGVSRRWGNFTIRAGYAAVESAARARFLDFADNHWTASLTWQPAALRRGLSTGANPAQ